MVRPNKKSKCAFFTILEMLIVMVLLAVLGGLLLFGTKGLVKKEQVDQQLQQLIQELSLTQVYARTYREEIEVVISSTPKGITFKRKSDYEIERAEFLYRPLSFSELNIDHKEIHLQFASNGAISPKLELTINKENTIIYTPPYSYKIKKSF